MGGPVFGREVAHGVSGARRIFAGVDKNHHLIGGVGVVGVVVWWGWWCGGGGGGGGGVGGWWGYGVMGVVGHEERVVRKVVLIG